MAIRMFGAMVLTLLLAVSAYAAWQGDLERLLETEPGPEQDHLISKVARAEPDWKEVLAILESIEFPQAESGLLLDSTVCIDGLKRPWVLYVPPGYDPARRTPLLVRLHGGVGRAEIMDDPLAYAQEDEFLPMAQEEGWFLLYPFGQQGATWWDKVGMANIRDLVRTVKRRYNIDDDRVWMEGFSDGASACFTYAMILPDDYAAMVALNGHMGVGSLDGDLPLYAPNLCNTPVYAITTKDDELYPSQRMRPTFSMAQRAGADILYKELKGAHDFLYAPEEIPRIVRFLKRHPRDPFPPSIVWEAADPAYGTFRWFRIDTVTTDEPQPWHGDYNTALIDDRITVGFVPDYSYQGPGVKVSSVVEKTAAQEIGLEKADVIFQGGGMAIDSMNDLVEYKNTLKRGEEFSLVVRRGDGQTRLEGRLPPTANYLIFKREVPSGLARVSFHGNQVSVESSRLRAFSILVHPDMIEVEDPLVVTWNGQVVHDKPLEPQVEFLIRNFLRNRDRSLLWIGQIRVRAEDQMH